MTQHYPKNTVFATHYCRKCSGFTQHRVDGGRVGPCIPCMEKLEAEHQERASLAAAEPQVGLFGAPVAAAPACVEESAESKEAKEARARALALSRAARTSRDLFSAASEVAAVAVSAPIAADPEPEQLRGTRAQELEFAQVRQFAEACDSAGMQYRGYAKNGAGEIVFDFSRRGASERVFLLRRSKWDRTPAMLEREAQRTERWL